MSQDPARDIAFGVLRAVDEHDAFANLELSRQLREHRIPPREAALATELVSGSIRLRGSYDAILDGLANRPLDPPVRDALRLGAHQLLSLRIPDHAAVSTTVAMVRRQIGHKPAGFVNAVLRKVAEKSLSQWLDQLTAGLDGDDALAICYSHPAWIIAELRAALDDPGSLEALLDADNSPPRVTLVARPGLCDPNDLPGEPGRLSPYARILSAGGVPGAIAQVRDGRAGVQDEGSQLVAITAANAEIDGSDSRWLDLCAGPGGKAALLGALAAQRGATLVANEVQPHRADLVRQSLAALPTVQVTEFDGRSGPWQPGSFDRVLVDAPCTGLGALRRRPEARWRRRPSDVPELVELQTALLDHALELVRPGGVVAYATCSPLLAETSEVVGRRSRTVDAVVESEHRWWPHTDGTDAMYVAVLRRMTLVDRRS